MTVAPPTTPWRIVSATIPGRSHEEVGLPNQDRCDHGALKHDVRVLAVADGAGSRAQSDRGAQFAVEAAIAAARCQLEFLGPWSRATARMWADETLREFDRRLSDEISASTTVLNRTDRATEPSADRADPRDPYATTLLAVAWRGPWFAIVAVGDCFLVVDREPGGAHLLTRPTFRENNGATVFMTSPNRESHMQVDVLHDPSVRGLALCSDGLAEASLEIRRSAGGGFHYAAPESFSGYFDFFANSANTEELLTERLSAPEFAEASSDDKTMILAVRTR